MKLVYLGTPEMAVPPLRALVEAGHEVVLVVTRADKRRGRGGATTPSPVKAAALELGLTVTHQVDDVIACGRAVAPNSAWSWRSDRSSSRTCSTVLPFVNLHFSLLPRWRGAAPVERAMLAGDDLTGVCVMRVEEGLDTGGVYAVRRVPISDTVTAAELRAELVDGRSRSARRDARRTGRRVDRRRRPAGGRGDVRPQVRRRRLRDRLGASRSSTSIGSSGSAARGRRSGRSG